MAGPEHAKLKLHAKKVGTIDLTALQQSARPAFVKRFNVLMTDLQKSSHSHDYSETISDRFKVPLDDAAILQNADFLAPFKGGPHSKVRYFCVVEEAKERRRPITWTKGFHDHDSSYVSEFSLPPTTEYADLVHQGSHAFAVDLAQSFWQVELPDSVNFVVTDAAGGLHRLQRLPFGVDCASEILQIIVLEVAHMARVATNAQVTYRVHIDGVLIVGAQDDLVRFKKHFYELCATFNITLNVEDSNEIARSIPFAGLVLDFDAKRVRLSRRFVDSVPRVETVRDYQDLERLMGKLIYGAAALRFPLHRVHFLVKTYRRRLNRLCAGKLSWRDPIELSHLALSHLRLLRQHVVANEWVTVAKSHGVSKDDLPSNFDDIHILVTDATLSSFGAVLYERGQVAEAFGGSFTTPAPSMGVAETAAVLSAVTRFRERLSGRTFVLLVDNSSTQLAVERLKSKHDAISLAMERLSALLERMGSKVLVGRVASGDNVADAPSRSLPLKEACIDASRDAAEVAFDLVKGTRVGVAFEALASG